jgi:hypothetical protein
MVNRDCVLIGVEGPHDQAFIAKVLKKLFGFKECQIKSELDSLWLKFIPTYPTQKGKLYQRLDMPSVLFKDHLSIAVYAGEGSNLSQNLNDKLSDIDYLSSLKGFAIVVDSDDKTPISKAQDYCNKLKALFPDFPSTTASTGVVIDGEPKLGIFVLPDNVSAGVLDTILCKCGDVAYSDFMRRAKTYISQFNDLETGWSKFDREKAVVAAVASILKPGGTNTATLSNNNWVSQDTYDQIDEIQAFCTFLEKLLDIKLNEVGPGPDQGGQPGTV